MRSNCLPGSAVALSAYSFCTSPAPAPREQVNEKRANLTPKIASHFSNVCTCSGVLTLKEESTSYTVKKKKSKHMTDMS